MWKAIFAPRYLGEAAEVVNTSHTCAKEINLILFRRLSGFKIFLLKMKKIDNYGLNYHRYRVQPLVLRILRHSF